MKKIEQDLHSHGALEQLREKVKVLPRDKRGRVSRGVPAELRAEIAGLIRESGLAVSQVSQAIGLSDKSIYEWMRQPQAKGAAKKKGSPFLRKKKKSKSRAGRFRELKISPDSSSKPTQSSFAPPSSSPGLILELPSGAKVHGLGLDNLQALLQGKGLS